MTRHLTLLATPGNPEHVEPVAIADERGGVRPFLRDVTAEVRQRFAFLYNGKTPLLDDQQFLALVSAPKPEGDGHDLFHADPLVAFNSGLPRERQIEILRTYLDHKRRHKEWDAKIKAKKLQKQKVLTLEMVKAPLWSTVASGRPVQFVFKTFDSEAYKRKLGQLTELKMRFEQSERDDGSVILKVLGHRVSCAIYKNKCPHPCNYCELPGSMDGVRKFVETNGQITSEMQEEAFEGVLQNTESDKMHPVTIDFIPDGSWPNDRELSQETRNKITRRSSRLPYLQALAVETRPEYVDIDKIKLDINNLGPDKKLLIYMGVETTDNLMASITQKGYGWMEFEQAVRKIAELPEEIRNQITVAAYNIMKLALMTDREALEESLRIERKIADLAKETKLDLTVKHEPTIVSEGTLQHYFFHQINEQGERLYENLNYFTVAETIARSHAEGLDQYGMYGQRADIDNVLCVAKVPRLDNDLLYSNIDPMVYDAVQRFNEHQNWRHFCVDIAPAICGKDGQLTQEFLVWEKKVYGHELSALRQLVLKEFTTQPMNNDEHDQQKYHDVMGTLCDQISKDEDLRSLAISRNKKGIEAEIQQRFEQACEHVPGSEFFRVEKVDYLDFADGDSRQPAKNTRLSPGYQVEVIVINNGCPSSFWMFVSAEENAKASEV